MNVKYKPITANNVTFTLIIFFAFLYSNAQITLTHNVETTPIETGMYSCERSESWSRVFKLSDFGISKNEQFSIHSGQIALSKSEDGSFLQYSIYSIKPDFPNFSHSTYPRSLLGTRGIGVSPIVNGAPKIINTDFEEPIIVPAGVERILVTVHKIVSHYSSASPEVFIAGTENDTGTSWYVGCEGTSGLTPTTDLAIPVPDANFYINVTGKRIDIKSLGTKTRLSHNLCDDVIDTGIHSCTNAYIYWARTFTLEEFGISANEEYIINSGQVGITRVGWTPEIRFNIYKIDDNFPNSFSENDLIGSSQYQRLSPTTNLSPQIIEVNFDMPIVIPANVRRVLVEVQKGIVSGDGVAFIAGSSQDNGLSWQRHCTAPMFGGNYVSTVDFFQPNANFYINVTGDVKHVTNNFQMNISNICSEFLKEFSLENDDNIISVSWNFGDPNSGINNNSTDLTPFHDFSADGSYTITATVTSTNGSVETLTENIDVKEPPNAYGIADIYTCEDYFDTGISSSFDLSTVLQQVLGGQTEKTVIFIDGSGNEYSANTLPVPFTNTIKDKETIRVRVSHNDNLCCYSEITFDLIVNPLPNLDSIVDLNTCDDDSDGYAIFDLQQLKQNIVGSSTNLDIIFYYQNGQVINEPLNAIQNLVTHEELIGVNVINKTTNCNTETTFKIKANPLPIANMLNELVGCDDNNDGISEYFDTSNVALEVLENQTNMDVSYFDSNGNPLPSPLPNPYTNTTANEEVLMVRVTNTLTSCYAETSLILNTALQPQINTPSSLFGCDESNGFSTFDTSQIEEEIISNQAGLRVTYYDEAGNDLPSPLPVKFKNTTPYQQTIYVRVENLLNPLCFSETSFDLSTNNMSDIDIKKEYVICDLEPFLTLSIDPTFDSYSWLFEDGTILSSTETAVLVNEGDYSLIITEKINNNYCERSMEFSLKRSTPPVIKEINHGVAGNNFIEIIPKQDGDYEYSIDGLNYQENNLFNRVRGGTYIVYIRDKQGCGESSKLVSIIDYPKFFTPNNDGFNDFWQLEGISNYPQAKIMIFNRFGKLLKQLSPTNKGWDGTYNGNMLPSSEYWFKVDIADETSFSGHFSLIR